MISKEEIDIIRNNYWSTNHNQRTNPTNLGFGFIHYALIRNFRPKRVLVVGSLRGYIPAICALACKYDGVGKVDFVDEGGNTWGGESVWKTVNKDYWKPLGIEDWITLYVTRIEDFEIKQNYQYIYLDADHSYEGAKRHFEQLWPKLDVNGLFVFHDVKQDMHSKWGDFGVHRLWTELKGEKFSIPLSAGLGIIRKTQEQEKCL